MKKSELLREVMAAVMESDSLSRELKIEAMKDLIERESLELYRERQAEKKKGDTENAEN